MTVTTPIGFDFRNTNSSPFTGDSAPNQAELGTTYTSGNFGWVATTHINPRDRDSTQDVRIMGVHFIDSTFSADWRVDVAAGTYDFQIALGDPNVDATDMNLDLYDGIPGSGGTLRFSVTKSGTLTNHHYLDANNTEHTSAANWAANQTAKTNVSISSGIIIARCGIGTSNVTSLAYLRIDASAVGQTPYNPTYQRGPIQAQ